MSGELVAGQLAYSKAGRDKDFPYLVMRIEANIAWVADGKVRRVENPKRKNIRHLRFTHSIAHTIAEKLAAGVAVTNAEVRQALQDLLGSDQPKGL